MTTIIIFKYDDKSTEVSFDKGRYINDLLIDRKGNQVTISESLKNRRNHEGHVTIFFRKDGPFYGKLYQFHDACMSGEELGLPYVESITHTTQKER
jgi:hypothetical protein